MVDFRIWTRKDLDMWEIIIIIARHIQTYMNAELFFLGLMAICFCIPCGIIHIDHIWL